MSNFIRDIRTMQRDSNSFFTFIQEPGDIIDPSHAKAYWSYLFNNAPGTYLVQEWISGIMYFQFIYIIDKDGNGMPFLMGEDAPFLLASHVSSKTVDDNKVDTITLMYIYLKITSNTRYNFESKRVTYTFTTKADGSTSLTTTEKKDDFSGAGTYVYVTKMADWSFVD